METLKIENLLKNTADMALKRRAKRLIEELDPQRGEKILECGCGDGFYQHLLSLLTEDVKLFGLDLDPRALQSAKRNLEGRGVELIEGDVMSMPFEDESFDKIIVSEVVEHLNNDLKGLKEVRRVLKKGGIMVLTVPNHKYPFLWDPLNKLLELLFRTHIKSGFFAGIWNQHLRLYYPSQIKKIVEEAGFEVLLTENITHYCLPFNHYLLNIGARLLYGGKMPTAVASQVSKFEVAEEKKPRIFRVIFAIFNWVDKFNENLSQGRSSVSVFVKAIK